ncbi:MAG: hypothetical protein J6K96_04635 [Treponema sp.]|nr:hypothetical protein [Treponema sp.]
MASAECCTITYARSPEKSAAATSRSTCEQTTKTPEAFYRNIGMRVQKIGMEQIL